jgi:hypothetical protein
LLLSKFRIDERVQTIPKARPGRGKVGNGKVIEGQNPNPYFLDLRIAFILLRRHVKGVGKNEWLG